MVKPKIILILIIVLAAVLRLVALNNFPAGLNADEASIGYNAYSLLQTGKDEYGSFLPLTFKSFGDWKPGLYFYMVMPFVALFGLNEWAVRLPSALLGILTVYLTFLLGREIFQHKIFGLWSAFLLAISPWHLQFSRGGWETNVATFFITLGILLFIKGLKNYGLLLFSLISFLASMYTYQSPRLIVPVLGLMLLIFYYQPLIKAVRSLFLKERRFPSLKYKFKLVIIVVLLLILTLPLTGQFLSGTGSARFTGLTFFSDQGLISRIQQLRGEHENPKSKLSVSLHNKLTAFIPAFLGHYLDHFSGSFLFINGDPLIRNKVPEVGQFYLIEFLFLTMGGIAVIKKQFAHKKILLIWILVAPLASAMTYQTPHALRALNLVVPLTLIMGLGMGETINWLKSHWRILGVGLITTVLVFEFVRFMQSYYIIYPQRYPLAWEYGFSEMVQKLNQYESKYEKVVITDRFDQPYILVLFYKQYDPRKYQPQAALSPRDQFNFGTVRSFDKYEFHEATLPELNSPGTLFIMSGEASPKNVKILDQVDFPSGEPAFVMIEGGQF
ncbi:MAG: glycosyltransferase family 39 protein [Candidatus Daviesbacteria bacterium]|nr:MAG: glycosyltransferase family 39 protein [Candidatus Daviesbacteria bacterium]